MEKLQLQWSLNDPIWLVRISVSLPRYTHIPDKTVYFRCRMSYDFVCRWLWFFEYLQSRIKVRNPRRNVVLYVARMNPEIRLGNDFIEYRRATLIKNRARKLKELTDKPVDSDLFGFAAQERAEKIEEVREQLAALERGEITFPVLPDFVNDVKEWI